MFFKVSILWGGGMKLFFFNMESAPNGIPRTPGALRSNPVVVKIIPIYEFPTKNFPKIQLSGSLYFKFTQKTTSYVFQNPEVALTLTN